LPETEFKEGILDIGSEAGQDFQRSAALVALDWRSWLECAILLPCRPCPGSNRNYDLISVAITPPYSLTLAVWRSPNDLANVDNLNKNLEFHVSFFLLADIPVSPRFAVFIPKASNFDTGGWWLAAVGS
jgi:hypothetical protein